MANTGLDPLLGWILRLALALLFVTAAVHKLRDPRAFVSTLGDYEILPRALVAPAAITLIASEITIALGLLGGADRIAIALAAGSLLLLYSFAIGLNLYRGRREIDCGCLGPAYRQPLSGWLLWRNLALIAGAAAIAAPVSARSWVLLDAVSLVGAVVTLALLFNAITGLAGSTPHGPVREEAS